MTRFRSSSKPGTPALSRGGLSLQLVDVLGAVLVAACLTGFVWVIAIYNNQTAAQIDELEQLVRDGRRELRRLGVARDRQDAVLRQRQAELSETGQLPTNAPVEQYFQALSTLASAHALRVARQNPLPARSYPGMLEQRYAYHVSGGLPDLLRFLKSIEQTDFWADVSYLALERGSGTEDSAVNARVAELTISLFSALPEPPPDPEGGA
ncbi:MAG: hypothetical protein PVI86_05975 [Phycisphaerae bacterium]|jgi:hypothetical protein